MSNIKTYAGDFMTGVDPTGARAFRRAVVEG